MPTIPPPSDQLARLRWLEARNARISDRLHALTRERDLNREEALRLRVRLTPEEAREYAHA